VTGQVIGDDDVALSEGGAEESFHIRPKGGAVYGAVEHHRGGEGVDAQAGDEGGYLPMPVRHGSQATLTFGGTPARAGQVGADASFIQEHQLGHLQRGLAFPPLPPCGGYVLTLLLAGVQGFF